MTSKQANSISIRDYLARMNIRPVKDKSSYGMYYSPFRAETAASFKVDYRKNLWYDFGSGEGGTMIDLAMKINGCTFHEAMKKLEGNETPFFVPPEKPVGISYSTMLRRVRPLKSIALTEYLSERGINLDIALIQCVEVHYSIGDRIYYAIGFKNDAGGYELRNRHFKGTVSPKNITTFTVLTNECMLFEGFMDYLSYLTFKQQLQPQMDTVVLNSTAHKDKAMNFLNAHSLVYSYLDNDRTGKRILSEIASQHGNVKDLSMYFEPCNDLNEYLVNKINKIIKNEK